MSQVEFVDVLECESCVIVAPFVEDGAVGCHFAPLGTGYCLHVVNIGKLTVEVQLRTHCVRIFSGSGFFQFAALRYMVGDCAVGADDSGVVDLRLYFTRLHFGVVL